MPRPRLLEQSNLRTHPTTSQFGQLNGVAFPFNESFKHLPGTFPEYISDDPTQPLEGQAGDWLLTALLVLAIVVAAVVLMDMLRTTRAVSYQGALFISISLSKPTCRS